MADPMRIRAALACDTTTVRVLMSHPMTTGKEAHFITDLEAIHNGKAVLKGMFSGAVSQNPFLSFQFKGAAKGDKVSVKWVDNKGQTRTDEATIA
jgi:sulfur-oxidizing protein SoxZ